VVESEVDQPAEVEGGHPGVQPPVVGGHAAVAQFAAAAFRADQPGDGAFDHGPVLAVGLAQVVPVGPVAAGLAQQRVVLVQVEGPTVGAVGAALPQRAAAAGHAEGDPAAGGDTAGD